VVGGQNFVNQSGTYALAENHIIHTQPFSTPYGDLVLGAYKGRLCLCDWRYRKMRDAIDSRICNRLGAKMAEGYDTVQDKTRQQLLEYFEGKRTDFDLPLLFAGTSFQEEVWSALMDVPYGTTTTYLALARKLGKEGAVRAVAAANGANALAIIVPCHRVVGSDGALVGYAGGMRAKSALLKLEAKQDFPGQLELFEAEDTTLV
jgi:methylated-DNA-[protein]-cysteine S-methyltransferase